MGRPSKYTWEFRRDAVALARSSGQAMTRIASDLGVNSQTLSSWVKQDKVDRGEGAPGELTTAEKQELTRLRRENAVLRMEREILKKSRCLFRPGDDPVSRYRYIVAEKATYPVRLLCRVLEVSPSGFYDWHTRGPSDRERADRVLLGWLRAIHGRSRGTYGAPRVHAELRQEHGLQVGRKRVARLMRSDGLARRRGLTKPDVKATPAPDLVGRDFSAASLEQPAAPGARMVGDITYLATGQGWLYLAGALDLATRSVLGYAMADHMRASLVVDTLRMAAGRIPLPAGAIFHSDRGSQYTSTLFAGACTELGVSRSMGRTGACFDNAAAESFWATLKRELGRCWWPTRAEARRAVFEYITFFYNRQRRHSALGYRTPQEALLSYGGSQVLAA